VLVEGPSSETDLLWEARLATQAPEIDGVCLISDCEGGEPRAGQFRRLRITAGHDYDLVGTLLEPRDIEAPAPASLFRILPSGHNPRPAAQGRP
jgi:ribosomal protein S12 methylthiotransferase